jgi:hypothetical protein
MRRVSLLISGGWRPPDWRPSGAGPSLGWMPARRLAGRVWDRPLLRATGVGRAPGGTARLAPIVPQEVGFEPGFGGLEVRARLVASPGESPNGGIVDLGDVDRCEGT